METRRRPYELTGSHTSDARRVPSASLFVNSYLMLSPSLGSSIAFGGVSAAQINRAKLVGIYHEALN